MTRCAGSDIVAGDEYQDGGPAPCPGCGQGVATYHDGPAGYRLRDHERDELAPPMVSDEIHRFLTENLPGYR